MKFAIPFVAALFGSTAVMAATTGVEATFSGSGTAGINVPTLTLVNTGDLGDITGFTLTVGQAATHGIDGWETRTGSSPGIVPTYNPNDFNLSGGGQYDIVGIAFTGFTPGSIFAIGFDVDLNSSNSNEDYRTDVLDGGTLTVTFSGGVVDQFDFDLTPQAFNQSSYVYADSVASAVPLPAGLPLMLTALGGAALLARRKRA